LLQRWEEEYQQGRDLSARELCGDDPALIEQLEVCLAVLRRYWAAGPTAPVAQDETVPDTVAPSAGTVPVTRDPNQTRPYHSHDQSAAPCAGIPGFVIEAELGRGGMGVVYRARQVGLNRVVALKMILSGEHASEDDRRRFLQEAQLAASLAHPHVAQVHAFGTYAGLPYFALEYCEGGSLAELLQQGPLPAREAAALLRQLALGVQAAHERGITHRDLKPGNVLLAFSREAERSALASALRSASRLNEASPKITDFGLARRLDAPGLTQTGAVMGTPPYMAPEQAAGDSKRIGPAVDVYALGAILYECLTGRPPFQAATPMETIRQVIHDEPLPVRELQPGVPLDLETICLKCLQKEPARRYISAVELAADLGRFLGGEPIQARPVGRLERHWRWCRRHPALTALGLVSVVAALALAMGSVGWYYSAELRAALDETRLQREEAERQSETAQAAQKQAESARGEAERQRERARRILYAAQMDRASEAWRESNLDLARSLLAGQMPSASIAN
jgi:hypothetical protein